MEYIWCEEKFATLGEITLWINNRVFAKMQRQGVRAYFYEIYGIWFLLILT